MEFTEKDLIYLETLVGYEVSYHFQEVERTEEQEALRESKKDFNKAKRLHKKISKILRKKEGKNNGK